MGQEETTMGGGNRNIVDTLVAGGAAGMIARTSIAPIERVKILFQVGKSVESYTQLVGHLVREEGIASLWKGNMAAVIRVVPYLSAQFSAFEQTRALLAPSKGLSDTPRNLIAGSVAGIAAVSLTYPLDVVRARMALQQMGRANTSYTGVGNALATIAQTEGIRGLYRGVSATLGGVAPYTGLKFAAYGQSKALVCKFLGMFFLCCHKLLFRCMLCVYGDATPLWNCAIGVEEQEMPTAARAFSGALAGTIALTFV